MSDQVTGDQFTHWVLHFARSYVRLYQERMEKAAVINPNDPESALKDAYNLASKTPSSVDEILDYQISRKEIIEW